jgi:hypothetical protein
VYADDGAVHREVDDGMIDRAAAAWAGRSLAEARKESIEEVAQWTVGGLRSVRPLFKYSWPDGQQVYVNGNTGEVAQYTLPAPGAPPVGTPVTQSVSNTAGRLEPPRSVDVTFTADFKRF